MNRLLFTVLLALAIAISIASLARAGGATPTVDHQRTAQDLNQNGTTSVPEAGPNKHVLSAAPAAAPVITTSSDGTPEICDAEHNCTKVSEKVNGTDVSVTVRTNGDQSSVQVACSEGCDVLRQVPTLPKNLQDLEAWRTDLANKFIEQYKDRKSSIDLNLEQADNSGEDAAPDSDHYDDKVQSNIDRAELKIKRCEATPYSDSEIYHVDQKTRGKKTIYTVKVGLAPKGLSYDQCLTDHVEAFSGSSDDDEVALVPDLVDALAKDYQNLLTYQAQGAPRKDRMEAIEGFIADHNGADGNDNLGLRVQALGQVAYFKSQFGDGIAQIQNYLANGQTLMASGDYTNASAYLSTAYTMLRSLQQQAPYISQAESKAQMNATQSLQQYMNMTMSAGTMPDPTMIQAMNIMSRPGAGNLNATLQQLNSQITATANQLQTKEKLGAQPAQQTSRLGAVNTVNAALLATPGGRALIQYDPRNGADPRDFNLYGVGDATGESSWFERSFPDSVGSRTGRLQSLAMMQTQTMCNTLQNGACNATLNVPMTSNPLLNNGMALPTPATNNNLFNTGAQNIFSRTGGSRIGS